MHRRVGGYDVRPRLTEPDRYYDDNAWISLALIEAHRINGNEAALVRAQELKQFLISGEDSQLGGGMYWRENERTTKNTCINAPAALTALLLHELENRSEDLELGVRLANWTTDKLQDPDTKLFWDHVTLAGKIDRRVYTYNTAVMIRVELALYRITGKPAHLQAAQAMATAAIDKWIDSETGAIRDVGRFAHMLLEALLELSSVTNDQELKSLVSQSAIFVHDRLSDDNGRYGPRWDRRSWLSDRSELIDQASAARLFFTAARDFK